MNGRTGLGARARVRLGGLAGCIALLAVPASVAAQQTAREIIDRVDRMLQGESSEAVLDMEIRTEHWTRTLEMRVWSLGTERAPADGGSTYGGIA